MKINSRIWFEPVNSNFHFEDWALEVIIWSCLYKCYLYMWLHILFNRNDMLLSFIIIITPLIHHFYLPLWFYSMDGHTLFFFFNSKLLFKYHKYLLLILSYFLCFIQNYIYIILVYTNNIKHCKNTRLIILQVQRRHKRTLADKL